MVDLNMGSQETQGKQAPQGKGNQVQAAETEDVQGEKIAVPAMRADGKSLVERAREFTVVDVATFGEAQKISQECARRKKVIDDRFNVVRNKTKVAKLAADNANSSVIALIAELKKPYDDAIAILDPKAREWQRAENKRLADEAEEKRKAEQKRLDDAREKEIAEANKKAEELAQSGNPEEAEEVSKLAVELAAAPATIATVEIEKVESSSGTSNRAHWKAVCHDLVALVKAIAEGKAPISLVVFDQSEGDAQARANHDAVVYPGVAFKDIGSTAHRV